jgi:hypothetical protein
VGCGSRYVGITFTAKDSKVTVSGWLAEKGKEGCGEV